MSPWVFFTGELIPDWQDVILASHSQKFIRLPLTVQVATCQIWLKYCPEIQESSDLQKLSIFNFIDYHHLVIVNLT